MIKLINQLLPDKKKLIFAAVSMGVDSLAAFSFLKAKGYNVKALHFNHNLRPQNAEMQKAFNRLEIGVTETAADTLKTETECRSARFRFFNAACSGRFSDGREHGLGKSDVLITAHHLDDYVESYLLNCFRGQPEYRPIKLYSNFPYFKVVHPFLLTDKIDFIDYANRSSWAHNVINDETNKQIKGSRRNWIRNNIIPEMESQKLSLKKYCLGLIKKDIEKLVDEEFSGC